MKIVIEMDETLTVGAYIEGVYRPTQPQCRALRDLAALAADYRADLHTHVVDEGLP
jgi:hypothetical protein